MPDPQIQKAAFVHGDTLTFRDASVDDAEFILSLRTDAGKSKYLSTTSGDVDAQRQWLEKYASAAGQAYFIIEYEGQSIGTVRLYDQRGDSFSWGSWILMDGRPRHAAMESALMVYSFAIDFLGFDACHFEVMKGNERVIQFHERFGVERVGENEDTYFFELGKDAIRSSLSRYGQFLSKRVAVDWSVA